MENDIIDFKILICSLKLGHPHFFLKIVNKFNFAVCRQISEKLVDSVLTSIVELWSKSVDKSLTQTQYLQMFLDMKYLFQLYNDSSIKVCWTLFKTC